MSLFLGLAFEDFFATRRDRSARAASARFRCSRFAGGVLYLFDPAHFVPFTAGLIMLGAWLAIFYRRHLREQATKRASRMPGWSCPSSTSTLICSAPVALALPPWVAVAITVAAVLLLTGREKLHALARRVEVKEIVTAGRIPDPDRDRSAAVARTSR